MSLRATDELRFALFRHWTLYDAMFHSSYVASKLGIWKDDAALEEVERTSKRLIDGGAQERLRLKFAVGGVELC